MGITINLPYEVEQELSERAAKNGQSLEQYLLLLAIRDADLKVAMLTEAGVVYPRGLETPEARVKAFREIVASFPPCDHVVDDSRESIYFGPDE